VRFKSRIFQIKEAKTSHPNNWPGLYGGKEANE
jgi:hypothetical protein